ncbi:hypothetical protein H9P43_005545 [Blastocladiella emersonii ATCC 22665]|nr:hypothetical protein H9P43_005545 [Blastocladiella emersonii ATCC 22665]
MLRALVGARSAFAAATPLPSGFLAAAAAGPAPVLATHPFRTTATTGCRRKKKAAVEVVDNRLAIKEAVTILNNREGANPHHAIHAMIKVRPEKGMPPIRGTVILPEKVPKNIRILCFADGAAAAAAKAAGADIVGTTDLLDGITRGEYKYDMVISTPESFPVATRVAKILGPKGLMPNAKKGTVTSDLATTIDVLKNSIRYSSGRHGNVNVTVGRVGFTPEQVEKNLRFVLNEVVGYVGQIPGKKKIKKNKFVHKVWVNSTFSPALPLRMTQFHRPPPPPSSFPSLDTTLASSILTHDTMPFCHDCGFKLPGDAFKFCPECGTKLALASAAPAAPTASATGTNPEATPTSFLDLHYAVNPLYIPPLRAVLAAMDTHGDGYLRPSDLKLACSDAAQAALYDDPDVVRRVYAITGAEVREPDLAMSYDAYLATAAVSAQVDPDAAWRELRNVIAAVKARKAPRGVPARGDFPSGNVPLTPKAQRVRTGLDRFQEEMARIAQVQAQFIVEQFRATSNLMSRQWW